MPAHLAALRIETKVLLALAAIAGLVLGFADLAEDALTGESHAFDRMILLWLRQTGNLSQPIGPHWLESALVNITALGSSTVITLITGVSALYLLVAGHRRLAVIVVTSVAGGALVETAMKLLFGRTRPEIVPHLIPEHSLSFPSGHAMLSTITYLTLVLLLARPQPALRVRVFMLCTGIVLALVIGFSRVYLGVHWPTDVLAGWTAGTVWVLALWLVVSKTDKNLARSGPDQTEP